MLGLLRVSAGLVIMTKVSDFPLLAICVLNSTPVDKQNVTINQKNTQIPQPLLSLFSGGENILKEETQ